jgi:hypothetical protein
MLCKRHSSFANVSFRTSIRIWLIREGIIHESANRIISRKEMLRKIQRLTPKVSTFSVSVCIDKSAFEYLNQRFGKTYDVCKDGQSANKFFKLQIRNLLILFV